MGQKPTISFEFFPPKNDTIAKTLWDAFPQLKELNPEYMTVTYGAGGSTRDGTIDTLTRMLEAAPDIPFASHFTFINSTKDQLKEYTDQLWDMGIKHIVALRGDMPDDVDVQWPLDQDDRYFQYTSDFVEGLKGWHDFEISVGCYPEKHPDAPSMDADIAALRLKCDAGSDRAITQFFFDNDVYYKFRDRCISEGIDTPIVPGLLPIYDFKSVQGFAAKCQASIPDWLMAKFDGLEDKPEDALKVASDLLAEQSLDLAANGASHIHFYTMNKFPITGNVCKALGY